jgi:succinylglutamate desuccinylase
MADGDQGLSEAVAPITVASAAAAQTGSATAEWVHATLDQDADQRADPRPKPPVDTVLEAPALPCFTVALEPPDLTPWRAGNCGVDGFWRFDAPKPGPHVVIIALIHGNEIAGAIALEAMLRAKIRPLRGRLTLGFANLDAYQRFDPARPIASRFVDEDMNRVWSPALLDGARRSRELDRARAMRAVIESADIVLDLHSMLWPSEPLMLCGSGARGKALALALGSPDLVVADSGHAGGRRLIDYPRFTHSMNEAACVLVEAGQHWQEPTVAQMQETIAAVLRHSGLSDAPLSHRPPPRFAEVTELVTAMTDRFQFVRRFRGGEIIASRGTLIGHDGGREIRTPHDDCLLIMPSLWTSRLHTAVRLARLIR